MFSNVLDPPSLVQLAMEDQGSCITLRLRIMDPVSLSDWGSGIPYQSRTSWDWGSGILYQSHTSWEIWSNLGCLASVILIFKSVLHCLGLFKYLNHYHFSGCLTALEDHSTLDIANFKFKLVFFFIKTPGFCGQSTWLDNSGFVSCFPKWYGTLYLVETCGLQDPLKVQWKWMKTWPK